MELDGTDDFINMPNQQISSSGTIEIWAKFSRERQQVLFDATVETGAFFFLDIKEDSNDNKNLRFRFEDAVGKPIHDAKINLTALPAGFDDVFHHIVASWEF